MEASPAPFRCKASNNQHHASTASLGRNSSRPVVASCLDLKSRSLRAAVRYHQTLWAVGLPSTMGRHSSEGRPGFLEGFCGGNLQFQWWLSEGVRQTARCAAGIPMMMSWREEVNYKRKGSYSKNDNLHQGLGTEFGCFLKIATRWEPCIMFFHIRH